MTVDEQKPQDVHLGQYAGFVTRVVAFVIDWLIVFAVVGVTAAVAGFLEQIFEVNSWLGLEQYSSLIMAIIVVIVSLSVILLYFIGAWMLSGQTLGKWIMGLRIVRTDGQRLRLGNCVRRYLGYWVSTVLFLGFLWILIDNRRQGFHDRIAGTFVLYAWPEEDTASRPIQDRMRRFRYQRRADQSQDQPQV